MDSNRGYTREFLRYEFKEPIKFKILLSPKDDSSVSKLVSGISKNLSVSGILFKSDYVPEISSILELDLDYRTMGICQEIEENAMIVGNKLIGKVVRVEDSGDGKYNIGVAFVKKSEQLPPGVKDMLE